MQRFKRNQVEEAIAATLAGSDGDAAALRTRIKRLLDADRAITGLSLPNELHLPYAFYTGQAPGSGSEVWFSGYEAFSLLIAFLLLHHHWPQGTVVRIMRPARPTLQIEHDRILQQDPQALFAEMEVVRRAAPGAIAVGNTDPVFLAIVSRGRGAEDRSDLAPHAVQVCRGEKELITFMRERALAGLSSMTALELANPAHLLAHQLSRTQPRARGRRGR